MECGTTKKLVIGCIFLLAFFTTHFRVWKSTLKEVDNATLEWLLSGSDPSVSQMDPRIVNYIKRNLLVPPSKERYNLKSRSADPSYGQSYYVRKLLKNKTNGFFVEAGAWDGESASNTLYLERFLGWTGLLVEGNPTMINHILSKNRKAWLSKSCLATKPFPHKANFTWTTNAEHLGGIFEDNIDISNRSKVELVQCVPLMSLLAALEVTEVDYLSLDIQGSEMRVLNTIPFDQVNFKVMTIEYKVLANVDMRGPNGAMHYSKGAQIVLEYLIPKGYHLVGISPSTVSVQHHDVVFAHSSFFTPGILDMHLSIRNSSTRLKM